jgi:histidine triad (HIT) family protein
VIARGAITLQNRPAGDSGRVIDQSRASDHSCSCPKLTGVPETIDPDCLFCKIVAGKLPGQIVDQDDLTVVFMDINPATRGHALVVPRRHARNLLEIEPEDLTATVLAAQRLAARAAERLGADGVNLINSCGSAAWQTVFHFHMHVIPRYAGDPLRLPWTPGPGDPGEIAAAAEKLR